MMTTVRRAHPFEKHGAIYDKLRESIRMGHYPPGGRLPTRLELAKKYHTTPVTVQKALARLSRDGFIVARRSAGTFVAERLPYRHHYGLVFGNDSGRFLNLLAQQARTVAQERGCRITQYHGIDPHVDTEDFQKLATDVHDHRLAGLIFATPYQTSGSPVLINPPPPDWPALPRVGIASSSGVCHLPVIINLDQDSVVTRGLDDLVAQGRHRVAVLTGAQVDQTCFERITASLAAHDLIAPAKWVMGLTTTYPQLARRWIAAIFDGPPDQRPDGLLITDDNLVEDAVGGLLDCGLRVPTDVAVVAHANFPSPAPSVVPVRRLGFDVRDVLIACLDSIDRQDRGEQLPSLTSFPARFEEEQIAVPVATGPATVTEGVLQ